jgi:hypothetical protein
MWRKIETLYCGYWKSGRGISQYNDNEVSCVLLVAINIICIYIYIDNDVCLRSVVNNIRHYRQRECKVSMINICPHSSLIVRFCQTSKIHSRIRSGTISHDEICGEWEAAVVFNLNNLFQDFSWVKLIKSQRSCQVRSPQFGLEQAKTSP